MPLAQVGTYYVMPYSREVGLIANTYRIRVDTDSTIPTLTAGTEITDSLSPDGDFNIYRVDVATGERLVFQVNGDQAGDDIELYVSHNSVPTLSVHEYSATEPDQPGQVLEIPSTQVGSFYVLVFARDDILAPDTYRIRVDTDATLPTLNLGAETTGSLLLNKDFELYRVDVAADERIVFQLKGDNGFDDNELFVSYDSVPSLSNFDFSAVEPNQPGQVLEIANTQAGTYYVMVYARSDTSTSGRHRSGDDHGCV